MIRVIASIFVLIIFSIKILAQNEAGNIVIISGEITEYTASTNGIDRPPVISLLEISGDSLLILDTLNYLEDEFIIKMHNFPDRGILYFEGRNLFKSSGVIRFGFLNYSDSLDINSILSGDIGGFRRYFISGFFIMDDNELYACNDFRYPEMEWGALNYKLHRNIFTVADLQNISMPSITSPFQDDAYFSYKYPDGKFDRLKANFGVREYNSMPDAFIQIPFQYRDSSISEISIDVNNDEYFIGQSVNSDYKASIDSSNITYVYTKNNKKIDTLVLPSNTSCKWAIDGDWIYGTSELRRNETYLSFTEKSSDFSRLLHQNFLFRDSLIRSGRNISQHFLLDKTGIGFFYDIVNENFLTFDMGSLDSEVLLFQDKCIFYRKEDEIRVVEVDRENGAIVVETDRLLVKDAVHIPNVHYLFRPKSE
ncbi:hypothetical protein QWY85_14810 [Neolewinella lacunae]|uniref:Uncharacterized protein n=1 Tax=Neolewinella lacunae TaxID=1517758 RepID=A0A923T7Q0_9BACT|nr:hypothetical protein [Neolewinella lacunae]MBC6993118.1 hypothetical protein [Neolewinella lacunae]MDN3635938.1 hypothetical protein [Neolewinella lacunae]